MKYASPFVVILCAQILTAQVNDDWPIMKKNSVKEQTCHYLPPEQGNDTSLVSIRRYNTQGRRTETLIFEDSLASRYEFIYDLDTHLVRRNYYVMDSLTRYSLLWYSEHGAYAGARSYRPDGAYREIRDTVLFDDEGHITQSYIEVNGEITKQQDYYKGGSLKSVMTTHKVYDGFKKEIVDTDSISKINPLILSYYEHRTDTTRDMDSSMTVTYRYYTKAGHVQPFWGQMTLDHLGRKTQAHLTNRDKPFFRITYEYTDSGTGVTSGWAYMPQFKTKRFTVKYHKKTGQPKYSDASWHQVTDTLALNGAYAQQIVEELSRPFLHEYIGVHGRMIFKANDLLRIERYIRRDGLIGLEKNYINGKSVGTKTYTYTYY